MPTDIANKTLTSAQFALLYGILALILILTFIMPVHMIVMSNFLEESLTIFASFTLLAVSFVITRGRLYIQPWVIVLGSMGLLLCLNAFLGPTFPSDLIKICIFMGSMLALTIGLSNITGLIGAKGLRVIVQNLMMVGLGGVIIASTLQHYFTHSFTLLATLWNMPTARIMGPMLQANLLGLYLFVGYVLTIQKFSEKSLSFVPTALLTFLSSYFIWGSGSRTAYVVFIAFLLALIYHATKRHIPKSIYSIVGLSVFSAPLFYTLNALLKIGQSQNALERDNDGFAYRLYEMRHGFEIFNEYMAFGAGYGRFGAESVWLRLEEYLQGSRVIFTDFMNFPYHAHNFFAQILAEFGLMGGMVILLGLVGIIKSLVPVKQWNIGYFYPWVFAVFALNSMLEYALWNIHYLALFIILLWGIPQSRQLSSKNLPLEMHRYEQETTPTLKIFHSKAFYVSLILPVMVMVYIYPKAQLFNLIFNMTQGKISPDTPQLLQATKDPIYGNEMQLVYLFTHEPSNNSHLPAYNTMLQQTLLWRPYSIVVLRKVEVAILTHDFKNGKVAYKMLNLTSPLTMGQQPNVLRQFAIRNGQVDVIEPILAP